MVRYSPTIQLASFDMERYWWVLDVERYATERTGFWTCLTWISDYCIIPFSLRLELPVGGFLRVEFELRPFGVERESKHERPHFVHGRVFIPMSDSRNCAKRDGHGITIFPGPLNGVKSRSRVARRFRSGISFGHSTIRLG